MPSIFLDLIHLSTVIIVDLFIEVSVFSSIL